MPRAAFNTIRAYYQQLNVNERQIADYLLANPESAGELTVQSLANYAKTSTASVSRFAKRVGYHSFRDFSLALATQTTTETPDFFGDIDDGDDTASVIKKVFRGDVNSLSATSQQLDPELMEHVIDLLLKAKRVAFFGIGGSSIVAFNAYHKFLRTPIEVIGHTDYDVQLMQAVRLTAEDVAIVISHSGRNTDTLLVADKARESGATIIALTSYIESPLAQRADIVLNSIAEEVNYRSESMSSLIAQLAIVDTLFTLVGTHENKQTQQVVDRIRPVIEETRLD